MITLSLLGIIFGICLAALITLFFGLYSNGSTERGVLTTFGRCQRTDGTLPHLIPQFTNEK